MVASHSLSHPRNTFDADPASRTWRPRKKMNRMVVANAAPASSSGSSTRACPICPSASETLTATSTVRFVAHQDSDVKSQMIVPLRHVVSISDLTDAEVLDIHKAVLALDAQWSRDRGYPVAFNVIWNIGHNAGQSLPHLHCHVLERTEDGFLPGYSPRFWLKAHLRFRRVFVMLARSNRELRAGGFPLDR